jgi:hypothetical protein
MAKHAFGGDDDSSGDAPPPEKRKLDLDKYGLSPDINIRDVFWKIMGSYAATKKPGVELKTLENDRFALMRIALSILSSQHIEHYGLAPRFIINYTLMMLFDGGWKDALSEFLERASEKKLGIKMEVAHALKKMLSQETYAQAIINHFTMMIRSRGISSVALEYLVDLESVEIVQSLKKELIILARGDIGQNQLNAIKAISILKEDSEIKKSFTILLSHWDVHARLAAARVIYEMNCDGEVTKVVEKRIQLENNDEIKEELKKIVNKCSGEIKTT